MDTILSTFLRNANGKDLQSIREKIESWLNRDVQALAELKHVVDADYLRQKLQETCLSNNDAYVETGCVS